VTPITSQEIFAGGETRKLSLKPRTMPVGDRRCCTGVVGIGDAPKIIDRSELPPVVDLSVVIEEITNQDGHSTCHSYAGAGVLQTAEALAGRHGVRLSQAYLVNKVTGGADDGAGIDQVMEAILRYGICPRDLMPGDNYRSVPGGANEAAVEFIPPDVWDCGGHRGVMDAMLTSLAKAFPVELGTHAFGGGHAVQCCGYVRIGVVYYFFGPNSWSANWTNVPESVLAAVRAALGPERAEKSHFLKTGGKGYWCFEERRLTSVDMFGAFAIQSSRGKQSDEVPA